MIVEISGGVYRNKSAVEAMADHRGCSLNRTCKSNRSTEPRPFKVGTESYPSVYTKVTVGIYHT